MNPSRLDKGLKTAHVMLFFKKNVDLADFLGVAERQISRYVRYEYIDDKYTKKIKREIDKRMKKLNRLAEEILK